jgi:sporulation protein YlmC with PRC-barrel domain
LEFKPVELIGSMVVDSEGYVYGRVAKIEIRPEGPAFKITSVKTIKESIPDIDALTQSLLEDFKSKYSIFSIQELYKFVAKELKVQSVTENDLISYAKLKEITIPIKEVSKDVEEEKPSIRLDDIEAMNKSEFGSCILLKTSIEAMMRGIEPNKPVLYQDEESLKEKLVIDNSGKILGKVHGIVMGAEGLRVVVSKESVVRKLVPDMVLLKKKLLSENTTRDIVKDMKNLGFQSPGELTDEKLVAYAKMRGYEIPTRLESVKAILLYKTSVPWEQLGRIGDVVLLKKTLPDIFEEESRAEELTPISARIGTSAQKPHIQIGATPISFLTRPGSFALGVYLSTFLTIFISFVPYVGALFSGGVAGYLARGWARGAIAGFFGCLLGTIILALISPFLLSMGLADFLGMILSYLPSSVVDAITEMLYTVSYSFPLILINASIGLVGGLIIGLIKS